MAMPDPKVLDTWTALNNVMTGLDAEQCAYLLKIERKGKARPTIINRLISRINRANADARAREAALEVLKR